MPTAKLLFPVSCKVNGDTFKKGIARDVEVSQAVYLSTRTNFEVDFGDMTRADIQKYMVEMEKSGKKPHDPDVVLAQIVIANAAVDPGDKSNFTKEGRVDSRLLSRILGYTVTTSERDVALEYPTEPGSGKGSRLKVARPKPVSVEPGLLDTGATGGVAI